MREILKGSFMYAFIAGSCAIGVRIANDVYNKIRKTYKRQRAQ